MNLDFGVVERSLPYLWYGFQYTVQLTAIAALGGLFFGTLLALARLSPIKPLAMAAAGYVNLMRSIPLVLVIFWFFFLMPQMLQTLTGGERPVQIGAERTAIITFIMFEAAYFCEIMRAGIQSIPRGQVHSAYALGLRYGQAMRLVILPQAFRNMIPVLLTQTMIRRWSTSFPPLTLSAPPPRSRSAMAVWWRCICSSPSCISCCATPCRIWSSSCRRASR